jgi:tRNA nucleotidyltransferase/poly(A) polymerase
MSMNAANSIDQTKLQQAIDPHTAEVLSLLNTFGIETRIVGGAVRDLLMGVTPRDIDLVADVDPSALIYIFESHGIDVDLGGIQHGTVKAVFGHGSREQKVDVSSLGYRITRHGQKLSIDRTHSWKVDSSLRDLTINSMSMTLDGKIYDYQNGIADLKNQTVRMCSNSKDSMTLDPLSMLRYFRAVSRFPHAKVVKKDLKWLADNAHLLDGHVLDKKASMLLIAILGAPNRDLAVKLMCVLGFDRYLGVLSCETTKQSL